MFRLAVVLPMYNEAGNVEPLMQRLALVREQSGLDLVALAIDDGSRDGTLERLAEATQRHAFVRTLRHPRNRGMAAALRTGIDAALAEHSPAFDAVAFMDADLTHAPEDLARLVAPIVGNRADFVLGSRYVPGGGMRGVPLARRVISILGNGVVRRLLGVRVGDLTSGFRAARTSVLRVVRLEETGFGVQLEGSVKAYRAGFRVSEIPITLGVRKSGYSKMAYTRSFWLGYARLIVRLALAPRVVVVPAQAVYAEVEESPGR